jgi:thiol-disulfide isomerase/thioredoxin
MRAAKIVLNALLVVAIIAVAYIVYGKLSQNAPTPDNTPATEARPAPEFTVIDGEGNQLKLSDFAGKPVVINFWASWCGNCKDEMPHFEKFYKEFGQDINFLMVNMTDSNLETLEKAKAFLEQSGYTFPVYFDTLESAAAAYNIRGIPLSYFLDEELNIVAYKLGAMDEDTLKGYIDQIA